VDKSFQCKFLLLPALTPPLSFKCAPPGDTTEPSGPRHSGTDLVADTPNAAGPNFGKPPFPTVTCNNGPNGDMFMNYMDYTDDDAMFMFTPQQVARIRATLNGPRRGLW